MDRPFGSGGSGPAFVRSVKRCDEIATIVVDHHNRAERPLCAEHWDLAPLNDGRPHRVSGSSVWSAQDVQSPLTSKPCFAGGHPGTVVGGIP